MFTDILYESLAALSTRFSELIFNLRVGKAREMRNVGINIGSCGVSTIRLRPMLISGEEHIPLLLDGFEKVFARIGK
ncbi:4-aminobutyrate aminotransferase [Aspergillus udagawae]|uniref:4-aminobutyrate aminotransferase n=1 Tax=Aspergillus udagawae TaxID=91492 RepID=A0A8H3XQ38_9EURO|nr:4-aminobutyrate aminotransferase [Aspergillus udagawae]